MIEKTTLALNDFTRRYCDLWQQETGHAPASRDLHGIPSPCILTSSEDEVWWQPQPFTLAKNLDSVERALDISLQSAVVALFTTQFAGDMTGTFAGRAVSLIQAWSEDDFLRMQENLIGHLVMKRRLKHSPTLFIATTDSELDVISVCNLSGEVIAEQLGTLKRQILSPSLEEFLIALQPAITDV